MIPLSDIEVESFRKIWRSVADEIADLSSYEKYLLMRVIHASGDFSLHKLARYSEDFIESGINAIKQRDKVVVDVCMTYCGIYTRAKSLDLKVYVASLIPKSVNSAYSKLLHGLNELLEREGNVVSNAFIVVGNSPIFLTKLNELVEQGVVKPSVIIGCPVGFVNAAEAKSKLEQLNVPYFTIRGSRGGSAVASAAFNALVDMATGRAEKILKEVVGF